MDDVKEKLVNLLIKIFQFENEDLDFGVYKILNYKKDEISQFIQKDLIEEIKNQLDLISSEEKKSLEKELEQLKKQLQELGIQDYEKNPKYITKKEELKNLQVSENLEKEIYNHIYTFFSRYYDKGDFISKRRYGRTNKYAIPYNGEETLLYWANNDQYYIKTSEFLQKYSFRIPDLKVNFRIVAAEEERGNVKSDENKYFIVLKDPVYTYEDKELNIYLEYRGLGKNEKKEFKGPNQDKINEYNIEIIIDSLKKESKFEKLLKTDKNGKNILEKHLNRYTARNTYDYFIHKDLKGFLDIELDFFIKNEILDLSDLTLLDKDHFHSYILEIKVIKNICLKIIDFLAQIENFQKKLWEKKKFVLNTNYILSIEHVPEVLLNEIIFNQNQLNEWKKLFNIEINSPDELLDEINKNISYQKLPIDTKYFDNKFKLKILSSISETGITEILNGIILKAENYHALNLIHQRFRNKINLIYIDPPFNTGNDDFLYKDHYKHSSWLTMLKSRLEIAKELLSKDGTIIVHIDDNEFARLWIIMAELFGENNLKVICVKMAEATGVKMSHVLEKGGIPKIKEYLIIAKVGGIKELHVERIPKDKWDSEYNLLVQGINEDEYRELIHIVTNENRTSDEIGIADELCSKIKLSSLNEYLTSLNITNEDKKTEWKFSNAWRIVRTVATTGNAKKQADEKKAFCLNDYFSIVTPRKKMYIIKRDYDESASQPRIKLLFAEQYLTIHPGDFWPDIKTTGLGNEGKVNLTKGKKPESLIRRIIEMSTDKDDLVLDFFLGSGTTSAVAHKTQRKYIGIEYADYGDDDCLVRLKTVIQGENSGISKSVNWTGGGVIQYNYLEDYDDTLENIEFSQKALDEFSDYFVRYMIDFETRYSNTFLNIDKMENPFEYKINVLDDYQLKSVPVDLPETYNYLIGLEVNKISTFVNEDDNNRKYLVIQGNKGNKNILVIWRDIRNFDPQKDRDFLDENVIKDLFDEIHLNGDSLIPDAVLIEENFKKLMNGS